MIAQILEALELAIPQGFRLPLVYNTSGYDSVSALKLLDGIVDINMPDLKYSDSRIAEQYVNKSSPMRERSFLKSLQQGCALKPTEFASPSRCYTRRLPCRGR